MPNERTTYINVTWFLLPFITYIKVPQFGSCNITQFTCSININYKYSHLHAIYTCVQMKRSGVGKRHKSKASLLSVILLQILFEDIKNHKGLIVSFFFINFFWWLTLEKYIFLLTCLSSVYQFLLFMLKPFGRHANVHVQQTSVWYKQDC